MIDQDDHYLMMWRSEHPRFGIDPDLPGGILEDGESALETVLREVREEIGVSIDTSSVKEVYSGTDYSEHCTHYVLYTTKLEARPELVISWEHSSYKWMPRDEFISTANSAKDTYMHMVGEIISNLKS